MTETRIVSGTRPESWRRSVRRAHPLRSPPQTDINGRCAVCRAACGTEAARGRSHCCLSSPQIREGVEQTVVISRDNTAQQLTLRMRGVTDESANHSMLQHLLNQVLVASHATLDTLYSETWWVHQQPPPLHENLPPYQNVLLWSEDLWMARKIQFLTATDRQATAAQTVVSWGIKHWDVQEWLQKSTRSEERRVGKECRSRWSPYH